MKFLDLFAGIGGFRRGMELAGHECAGFCEWDKFAAASYTSMHLASDKQRDYLSGLPLRKRQKEILKGEYRNGEWYADDIRAVDAGGFQTQTAGAQDSRARTAVLPENSSDLMGTEAASILKLLGCSKAKVKKIDPAGYSLKTLKTCYQSIVDGTLQGFSLRWMKSGMTQNGGCLIPKTLGCPKTGKGCSLSDIIETEVEGKYFLSKEHMEKITSAR